MCYNASLDSKVMREIMPDCNLIAKVCAKTSLTVANTTVERFTKRIRRLYEQRASKERVATYVKHWLQWVKGGLGVYTVIVPDYMNYYLTQSKQRPSGLKIILAG